jgi:hypothetical protein
LFVPSAVGLSGAEKGRNKRTEENKKKTFGFLRNFDHVALSIPPFAECPFWPPIPFCPPASWLRMGPAMTMISVNDAAINRAANGHFLTTPKEEPKMVPCDDQKGTDCDDSGGEVWLHGEGRKGGRPYLGLLLCTPDIKTPSEFPFRLSQESVISGECRNRIGLSRASVFAGGSRQT